MFRYKIFANLYFSTQHLIKYNMREPSPRRIEHGNPNAKYHILQWPSIVKYRILTSYFYVKYRILRNFFVSLHRESNLKQ